MNNNKNNNDIDNIDNDNIDDYDEQRKLQQSVTSRRAVNLQSEQQIRGQMTADDLAKIDSYPLD